MPAQTLTSESTAANGNVVRTTVTASQSVVISTSQAPQSTGATANGDASDGGSSSSSNGGVIGGVVGGVVGGLALLCLLVFIGILWRRRRSRTGHGWFLCFGRRPDRKHDLDVDWPTFDPTLGAAGVGGTLGAGAAGAGSQRRKAGRNGHQGTLPAVDGADEGDEVYGGAASTVGRYSRDEMRDMGGSTYGGGAGAASYYGNGGAPGSETYAPGASHDGGHAFSSQGAQSPPGNGIGWGLPAYQQNHSNPSAPDYGHLDPPEVREQRAREQAEAEAQARAAYGQRSPPGSPSPRPLHTRSGSIPNPYDAAARSAAGSPPPPSGSPPPTQAQQYGRSGAPEHRFSAGTAAMFANSGFWGHGQGQGQGNGQDDDDAGTVADGDAGDQRSKLHLLNP